MNYITDFNERLQDDDNFIYEISCFSVLKDFNAESGKVEVKKVLLTVNMIPRTEKHSHFGAVFSLFTRLLKDGSYKVESFKAYPFTTEYMFSVELLVS